MPVVQRVQQLQGEFIRQDKTLNLAVIIRDTGSRFRCLWGGGGDSSVLSIKFSYLLFEGPEWGGTRIEPQTCGSSAVMLKPNFGKYILRFKV
jgi:hypothetical protein